MALAALCDFSWWTDSFLLELIESSRSRSGSEENQLG